MTISAALPFYFISSLDGNFMDADVHPHVQDKVSLKASRLSWGGLTNSISAFRRPGGMTEDTRPILQRQQGAYPELESESEQQEQPGDKFRVYLGKREEKLCLQSLWTILQCKEKFRKTTLHFVVKDGADTPLNPLSPRQFVDAVGDHYAKSPLDPDCVEEKKKELQKQYNELMARIYRGELTVGDDEDLSPQLTADILGYSASKEVAKNYKDSEDNSANVKVFTFHNENLADAEKYLAKKSWINRRPVIFDTEKDTLEKQLKTFITAVNAMQHRIENIRDSDKKA